MSSDDVMIMRRGKLRRDIKQQYRNTVQNVGNGDDQTKSTPKSTSFATFVTTSLLRNYTLLHVTKLLQLNTVTVRQECEKRRTFTSIS